MKNIFDKTEIKNLKLKNRLFRSATWEALADENGHFDEEIYRIYDQLAAGGVGCIISGFTSVSDRDLYFGGMARLSNDGLMEMLTDNPCKRVTVPKGEKKEKDIYTLEEVAQLFQLLETAPLKYRTFFTLAIYSGFRRGEMLALEWKDIDWEHDVISVR